jgi:5-methylcytosine-specific restriction enzyme subunit McrC
LLKDEEKMHRVFEEFVRNFYRTEQSRFRVSRSQVAWDLAETSPLHDPFLPAMQTDITLQSFDRTIIMDTKFYGQILSGRGSPKVQSSHLYQIMTYLTQWHAQNQQAPKPSGLLLYARTQEQDLDLRYVISGFELRVKTVDLRKPWREVDASLLELLGFQKHIETSQMSEDGSKLINLRGM